MKWHTASFGTTDDLLTKKAMEERIAKFWQEFAKQSKTIAEAFRVNKGQELESRLNYILKPVHQELLWEVSLDPQPSSKLLVLAITSGDDLRLRPISNAIIEAAPDIEGWQFTKYKPPLKEGLDYRLSLVERNYTNATCKITENSYGCFDVTVRSQNFKEANNTQDWNDAFLLCPHVFGEELFEVWIDWVFTEPEPIKKRSTPILSLPWRQKRKQEATENQENQDFYPLSSAPAILAKAVTDKIEKLPVERCWERIYESVAVLSSEKSDRKDRLSFTTPHPEVIEAYERRYCFNSATFSRYNEVFAYLKLAGSFVDKETLVKRHELEDELDEQLRAQQAGCLLGGGIGFEDDNGVSFIDFLISDLPKAVEIMRRECKRIALPPTSWLLFLDSYWADEWVGMDEHSPPPPPREKKKW